MKDNSSPPSVASEEPATDPGDDFVCWCDHLRGDHDPGCEYCSCREFRAKYQLAAASPQSESGPTPEEEIKRLQAEVEGWKNIANSNREAYESMLPHNRIDLSDPAVCMVLAENEGSSEVGAGAETGSVSPPDPRAAEAGTTGELEELLDEVCDAWADYVLSDNPDSLPTERARSAITDLFERQRGEIEMLRENVLSVRDRYSIAFNELRASQLTSEEAANALKFLNAAGYLDKDHPEFAAKLRRLSQQQVGDETT